MRKQIIHIIFCCTLLVLPLLLLSQETKRLYPNFINQSSETILKNKSWYVLKKAEGDLNKDLKSDLVLILESKDSIYITNTFKIKPRIILVLINNHISKKVIIQNNKFIARGDEGGMLPFLEPEISIENNALTIYYQYTRGNQSYTFEFLDEKFVLTKAKSHGITASSGDFESYELDFKDKTIHFEYGNISRDKVTKGKINLEVKPKPLSDFGEMYEWQIAENIYL